MFFVIFCGTPLRKYESALKASLASNTEPPSTFQPRLFAKRPPTEGGARQPVHDKLYER